MNQVRKPDGVLYEEDRDVVPDDVLDASEARSKHDTEGQ